jgi:hypothetical protein
MRHPHHLTSRVVEENRHTVSKTHQQRNVRLVGEDGICPKMGEVQRPGVFGAYHYSAVHLPDIVQRRQFAPGCLKSPPAVLGHARRIVAHQPPQVEGGPRLRTDTPPAGKYGVYQAGFGEGVEGVIAYGVRLVVRH